MREVKNVAVIGLGYIGLPTAALVASKGYNVTGVDVNEHVVKTVSSGAIHIVEPDLDGLVQKVITSGKLSVSSTPVEADVFLIAVPTPIDERKRPDLRAVTQAVESIIPVLRPGNLVILESTAPVGTTEVIATQIAEARPDLKIASGQGSEDDVSLAYCPERVLPGRILTELINNDRCIGGITPRCARYAQRFYKSFVRGTCIATSARVAEMVKLTENAFRDTNIAFANELSLVCDDLNVNVWEVIDLANRHPRVNILRPGPGVGGHCIAVDPWFIVDSSPKQAKLIRASREVNDAKADYVVEKAKTLIEEFPYANVACLGLAFKANVDDLRESPALDITQRLAAEFGTRIKIVEPYVQELPTSFDQTGAQLVDLDEALSTCEVAIVLVDHDQFKMVPLSERRHLSVIDTRGIW